MLDLLRRIFSPESGASALLKEAQEHVQHMLTEAGEILETIQGSLLEDPDQSQLKKARVLDKASNRHERAIRKLLVEHLSYEVKDGPACLVLMSVAKDAERMVDECRSLVDLGGRLDEPLPSEWQARLQELFQEIRGYLAHTQAVVQEQDESGALDLIEGEKGFVAKTFSVEDAALASDDISKKQMVTLSRCLHIFQRIRAHLGNIASTVVFPVHRINFAKRRYVEEAREKLNAE